jgi:Low molecular weight phosphotyrosine protein phosphatase
METPAHRFKILFLCTWNASRSIFAEYFMKDIGSDRFEALSAGVTPSGQVSPITISPKQRAVAQWPGGSPGGHLKVVVFNEQRQGNRPIPFEAHGKLRRSTI